MVSRGGGLGGGLGCGRGPGGVRGGGAGGLSRWQMWRASVWGGPASATPGTSWGLCSLISMTGPRPGPLCAAFSPVTAPVIDGRGREPSLPSPPPPSPGQPSGAAYEPSLQCRTESRPRDGHFGPNQARTVPVWAAADVRKAKKAGFIYLFS